MTIYTSPSCTHCQALKSYLKIINVEYKEIDVSIDQEALTNIIPKVGELKLPIVENNGKYVQDLILLNLKRYYENY